MIKSVKTTTDIAEAVKDADIIIENSPELIEVKQDVIVAIESACRDDAIITTSTSGLPISQIVAKAKRPERIMGAHPYHPVYLLPLLEMIRNAKTEDKYVDAAMAFFTSIDKKPVVLKKESDGYIGSHLMSTLLREAINLVITGVCTMEDVDTAFTFGPGMRYGLFGIFTTLQLTGGEKGIQGVFTGPMGKSGEKWLESFADWKKWPAEAREFMDHSQEEMNKLLANRDEFHGRDNAGLTRFRDQGLVKILKAHKLL